MVARIYHPLGRYPIHPFMPILSVLALRCRSSRHDSGDTPDNPTLPSRTRMRTVPVVIGMAAVAVAWACNSPQRSAIPNTGTARDSADQVLYGAHSVLTFNGLRRGEISGDTVMSFDAATRFEFRGFRAQFTTTLGRPLSSMTAPAGMYRI